MQSEAEFLFLYNSCHSFTSFWQQPQWNFIPKAPCLCFLVRVTFKGERPGYMQQRELGSNLYCCFQVHCSQTKAKAMFPLVRFGLARFVAVSTGQFQPLPFGNSYEQHNVGSEADVFFCLPHSHSSCEKNAPLLFHNAQVITLHVHLATCRLTELPSLAVFPLGSV